MDHGVTVLVYLQIQVLLCLYIHRTREMKNSRILLGRCVYIYSKCMRILNTCTVEDQCPKHLSYIHTYSNIHTFEYIYSM